VIRKKVGVVMYSQYKLAITEENVIHAHIYDDGYQFIYMEYAHDDIKLIHCRHEILHNWYSYKPYDGDDAETIYAELIEYLKCDYLYYNNLCMVYRGDYKMIERIIATAIHYMSKMA
jgi:hypothetical protein